MPGHNNTFFAIDFDRCIGDVAALYGHFADMIVDNGYITSQELAEVKMRTEASGGSFDVIAYLVQKVGSAVVNELLLRYAQTTTETDQYLLPGAPELLTWLKGHYIPHGIITYGGNAWQRAKIARAGCADVPTLVTESPVKGEIIASWYDMQSKTYRLPEVYGVKGLIYVVVLIDDKAPAFSGLDRAPNSRGYWVRADTGTLLVSQQGTVAPDIRTVQSLRDIVNYEQNILT